VARWSLQKGHWQEEKRKFQREVSYDIHGDISEEVSQDSSTALINRHHYAYDQKGNRVQKTYPGGLSNKAVSIRSDITLGHSGPSYDYDDRMVYTQLGITDSDGTITVTWIFQRDDAGNAKVETITYGGDLEPHPAFRLAQYKYIYDWRSRVSEMVRVAYDGSVLRRYVYNYDDTGLIVERTVYKGSNSVISSETYTYEVDSTGNWTKRSATRLVSKNGKSQAEPEAVTHRTITYY